MNRAKKIKINLILEKDSPTIILEPIDVSPTVSVDLFTFLSSCEKIKKQKSIQIFVP